jgi:Mn2+/Fe2+ NRAMP family transporter
MRKTSKLAPAPPAPSSLSAKKPSLVAGIQREPNICKRLLRILGPGLITGASDDDPSGIGTYTMAGAAFGYQPLWIALLTWPLMASIQFICAKIALVSWRGLAGVLRQH